MQRNKMIIFNNFLWHRKFILLVIIVITANVYTTNGQSYLLAIGQNPHVFFEREVIHHSTSSNNSTSDPTSGRGIHTISNEPKDDKNSTVIVIKKSVSSNSSDLSQTAMDVITIIWYVATFMALAAFFLLMACSDRRCNARRHGQTARSIETPNSPPTPSPSYSEFAPPSYESVMKLQNVPGIYVIPFSIDEQKEINTNESNDNPTPNPVVTTFYTANETQKSGR